MNPWKKMIIASFIITLMIIVGTTIYFQSFHKRRLIISTTTSLYDTGLLHAIKKAFEAKHPVDLNFIPVGTGIAIQHAKNGDADVILVHSPSLEKAFLEEGYGVCRKIIAYNFFTIVGPQTDPAKIMGLSPVESLQKIVESGRNGSALWISRGDNSGTHCKEKELWNKAGFEWETISQESSWYVDAGSKMGPTLRMAEEMSAYTLTDMGTYLKYYKDGLISLEIMVSQGEELLNVYSVIAVNQTLHQHVNFEDAISFIKFLVSEEGQQLIENYGKDEYGQSLFFGTVNLLKQSNASQIAEWIRDYAFFNDSECPLEYRGECPELYTGEDLP